MNEAAHPDWYLQEWMTHFGKRQADLVNELGWLKGRASKFWNGQHSYRREIINEISAWLGIEPFELLMHPVEALALRQLRQTAATIVAGQPHRTPRDTDSDAEAPPARRNGTTG
ncbi:MAG: hypothetical protein ACXU82_03630 [Caulobacteraceae bacterium]